MTVLTGLSILILGGMEWGWLANQSGASQALFHSYAKPSPAPDFSLEDIQGKRVDIRDFRGRVILLNFWATWCPNCRKEASSLDKLWAAYSEKGLILYRLDHKESRETVNKFLEKEPSQAPILLDENGKVGRLFGVWAHPTSYLIDRKGFVRYRAVGACDWMCLEATSVIDALLKE